MHVIGVTGGIGSGKSTLSSILASYGAEVIDADKIAKRVMEKGEQAYNDIVGAFGNEVLSTDGNINRKALAEIVFNNKDKLDILNRVTHKRVAEEILKKLEEIYAIGDINICVLDVPIPVKHGFIDTADEIWVVTAPIDTRIKRIMSRSSMTYEEAVQRINSQIPEEEYIKLADYILENNGELNELEEKVSEYLKRKSYW